MYLGGIQMKDFAGILNLKEISDCKDTLRELTDFAEGNKSYFESKNLGLVKIGGKDFNTDNNKVTLFDGVNTPTKSIKNCNLSGSCCMLRWEDDKNKLILSEDSSGTHPIYYTVKNRKIIFGTDIKFVLMHPEVDIKPDFVGINQTLTMGGAFDSRTLFKGIKRVGPGNLLWAKENEVKRKRWFKADLMHRKKSFKPKKLLKEIKDNLKEYVKNEDEVIVPLSGGIDSSFLVDLLSRETEVDVTTHTIFLEDVDESNYARQIADRYNTNHRERVLDSTDLRGTSSKIWDVPNDLPLFHLFILKEKFSSIETDNLILQGEGPDVLFKTSKDIMNANFPWQANKILKYFPDIKPPFTLPKKIGKAWELATSGDSVGGLTSLFTWLDRWERRAIYSDDFKKFNLHFEDLNEIGGYGGYISDKRSLILLKTFLSNHLLEANTLLGKDRGCDVIYPYISSNIINHSFKIHPREKINKKMLKVMCKDRLPQNIIERKKTGFGHYMRSFVEKNWGLVENYILKLSKRKYFSRKEIEKILLTRKNSNVYFRGNKYSYDNRVLDFLFGLELWFETFIDPEKPKKSGKL